MRIPPTARRRTRAVEDVPSTGAQPSEAPVEAKSHRRFRLGNGGARQKLSILSTFGASQLLVFVTGVARIPIVIHTLGTSGYGLLLAIASLLPWVALVVGSLTNLARAHIAECIGASDADGARHVLASLKRSARKMSLGIIMIGVLLAGLLPWSAILGASGTASTGQLRLSIGISAILMATATSGAVSLGVMHAYRRVAIAQALPGAGAVVSLAATVVALEAHWSLLAFVVATSLATCCPYWLATLLGKKSVRMVQRGVLDHRALLASASIASSSGRKINARALVVMTGAAAPPLFSTGLDPIVLSLAIGPVAVASYGLATRLGLLVTLLPAGLYPLLWANFARIRATGDAKRLRAEYWRELRLVVGGTALLAVAFALFGPEAARLVGGGKVAVPELLYASVSALGVLVAIQAVTLPVLGGRKTAPWTAGLVYGLVIPNVALSYVLAKQVGPAGPILASIVATTLFLCACWWLVKRDPSRLVDAVPARADGPA